MFGGKDLTAYRHNLHVIFSVKQSGLGGISFFI
jgi:hypothetical protein